MNLFFFFLGIIARKLGSHLTYLAYIHDAPRPTANVHTYIYICTVPLTSDNRHGRSLPRLANFSLIAIAFFILILSLSLSLAGNRASERREEGLDPAS